METIKVKIKDIKNNPNNPRIIKDHKFKQLVKSIIDFPEMLKIREIIVDENMIILGGNMRYKACVEAGLKEIEVVKITDLSDEQKKEFIIKDNVNYGLWDWDVLANEFDTKSLNDWGLNIWNPDLSSSTPIINNNEEHDMFQDDDDSESEDDFTSETKEGKRVIQIEFKSEDYQEAFELYQEMRRKKIDIGLILINQLKNELCK